MGSHGKFRFVRGLVIGAGSYAVLRYSHSENSLRALFEKDLTAAKPLANAFGYNLDNSSVVRESASCYSSSPRHCT